MWMRLPVLRMAHALSVLVALCALLSACGLAPSSTGALLDGPPPDAFPATWRSATSAPQHIVDYAFAASDPQTGYACAAAADGLAFFVTKDAGATWQAGGALPSGAGTLCQLFVDDTDAAHLILGRGAVDAHASIQIAAPRLLYHSRDGGRTWATLPALPGIEGSDSRNVVDSVAVLGNRLLAAVRIDTSPSPTAIGAPSYALYALATGAHEWARADQAFASHGLGASGLETAGAVVLVSAYPDPSAGASAVKSPTAAPDATQSPSSALPSSAVARVGSGSVEASAALHPSLHQSLAHELSGPAPGAQVFRSVDAGSTWSAVSMPFTHPDLYGFVRAQGGSTYYGAGLDYGNSAGLLYSADAGASWKALPNATTLHGRSGQPLLMGSSNAMIAAAPDGSVFAPLQTVSDAQPDGFGVLRVRPGDSGARWAPLAHGPWVSAWHTTSIAGGVRLWGLLETAPQEGGELVYVDSPSGAA